MPLSQPPVADLPPRFRTLDAESDSRRGYDMIAITGAIVAAIGVWLLATHKHMTPDVKIACVVAVLLGAMAIAAWLGGLLR